MRLRRLTKIAVCTTLALLMFLIEGALPPIIPIAGVKIGLSNVVVFTALVILGPADAYIILISKCLLGSLFGNPSAIIYSIPAGLASLTVEWILYKFLFPRVSLVFISFIAAICHNFSQVLIASLISQTNLAILLPLSLLGSLLAGCFIGLVVFYTVKHLPAKLLR